MEIKGIEKFNEMFKKGQYKNLSKDDQNKFIRHVLTEFLTENPNGLTATQLENVLPFDGKTIRMHLNYLTAIREAYSVPVGRTFIYYPNGKLARYTNFENVAIGSKYYSFFDISNQYGKFVYAQEKEKDSYNTFKVTGGILIEKEKINEFVDKMCSFVAKTNKREAELNG